MGGGGVGLYVRDTYSVEVLATSDPIYDNSPEFIICELRKDQLRLLFAAVYRRTHASYPVHFFDCLSSHLANFSSAIITGDFNMNMALPNSPDAIHLQDSIRSNSLQLVPSNPTHHQLWRGLHTWIDLFIVKSDDRVLTYSKSDAPFSGARSSGAVADIARFRSVCAQASNAFDSAKNNHVASRLAAAPSADAKWHELRRLHVTSPGLPSPLVNFTAADLNAIYASTVSCHPPITEQDFEAIANHPFPPTSSNFFCLRPFSLHEVADALQKSSSKASGHDGLSLPMIKLTLPYSLPHITNFFNVSIATVTFPTNWKKATIRPLAKTKVMAQPSDTRPIAHLPELQGPRTSGS